MSEGSTSSVSAEETTESKPVSTAPGKKRNPWLMIIAIVVVLILIGSAAVVLMRPKEATLSVKMSPSSLVINAGSSRVMTVYPMDGDTNLTGSTAVTYKWSVLSSLGSLSLYAKQKTNFTAATVAGNGTIKCTVTFKGLTEDVSASVTVLPPYLEQVSVAPSVKTLGHGVSQVFNATAISSVGRPMSGVPFTWDVSGLPSANYTLSVDATTVNATFTSGTKDVVNATLNATATYHGVTKTGTALITVTLVVPVRSVDYLWYDMFNVPFKSYWSARTPEEHVITHTYPYIYTYEITTGNIYYYSDLRLNMTAKNLTSVSTATDPLFFPQGLFNGYHALTKGGTMTVDWSMTYPTRDEINTTVWKDNLNGQFDGWIVRLQGTITLDKEAALSALGGGAQGLTPTILDSSFASWWSGVQALALVNWHSWLNLQGGPAAPYGIYPMYNYDMNPLIGSLTASKVGDKVVLTFDDFSWGMECLMAKWLRHAFNPSEWFMYEFNMHAVIGPEVSDIRVSTAVMYALYAYETMNIPAGQTKGEPDWVFENCLGDTYYSRTTQAGEHSEMDPYSGLTYVNNAPGSGYYGASMPWDYTPGAWNLSANETMTFKWPVGRNMLFYKGIAPYVVAPVMGPMVVKYGEPVDKDMPTHIKTDNKNGTQTYIGPIDMWDWSKTQTADQDLVDLWTSTGDKVLPQGAPFIEFKINLTPPSVPDHMTLSDVANPVVVNAPTSIKVTVWDQYGQVLDNYTGTVNFTSNRTGASLPANYAFTLADAGSHVFTGLSFSGLSGPGPWNFTIYVKDAAHAAVNGSISNIMVIPFAQEIDHFAVSGIRNMNGGDRSNMRVIAYDQYGMNFLTYTGTVSFSTNATGAYSLPANYAFVLGDNGEKTFSLAVSFESRGVYNVTVADTLDPSANGTQMNIVIASPPRVTYTAYDFFKEPWHEWWYWRGIYEWNIVLCNTAGNYTLIYNKDSTGNDALIYAPYRWNTTAYNLTSLDVTRPEFMPVYDSTGKMVNSNASLPGSAVNMTVDWNYMNWTWWNNTIYPDWHSNPDWSRIVDQSETNPNSTMYAQRGDGYYLADIITAVMNREAARTWLNLSLSESDPVTWWNTIDPTVGITNGRSYIDNWTSWVLGEGNSRLDIFGGYADKYYSYGTMGALSVLPNGDVRLTILHFNGGMEVLMTRWLTESQVCTHQPYAEDFKMAVKYRSDGLTDVTYDEVAEYNFHAVMANGTAGGAAWVWEAQHIDYDATSGHRSDYKQYSYSTVQYPDYNCGDPNWGNPWGSPVAYENAPSYFNLTSYETLILKMPNNEVVGYLGKQLTTQSIVNASAGDFSDYNNLTVRGHLDLGYYVTNPFGGGANLTNMWNNTTNVLTIHGEQLFDQYHWQYLRTDRFGNRIYQLNYSCTSGPLLHGAPWIEFDVTSGGHVITAKTTSVASGGMAPSALSTVSADLLALASVVCGTMLGVAGLAVGMRRVREE